MGQALWPQPLGRDRLKRKQIARRTLGLGPQAMIQITTDQQQEQQGYGGFEIGMLFVQQGLIDTDAERQDHAQRNGHIHIGLALG